MSDTMQIVFSLLLGVAAFLIMLLLSGYPDRLGSQSAGWAVLAGLASALVVAIFSKQVMGSRRG
ncbi:MAG: hypothetical protein ABW200_14580 [Hyphomicrobiaceae bacterium]